MSLELTILENVLIRLYYAFGLLLVFRILKNLKNEMLNL